MLLETNVRQWIEGDIDFMIGISFRTMSWDEKTCYSTYILSKLRTTEKIRVLAIQLHSVFAYDKREFDLSQTFRLST